MSIAMKENQIFCCIFLPMQMSASHLACWLKFAFYTFMSYFEAKKGKLSEKKKKHEVNTYS